LLRSNRLGSAFDELQKINLKSPSQYKNAIKTQEQLDYALQLLNYLVNMKDYEIRVESPWVSVYTNNAADVTNLANIDKEQVKYVSLPSNSSLEENTIILPKVNFDYRVTLGKTTQEYSTFIAWAEANKKLRLTKGCKRELLAPRSWGGTYFYVSGDNNLLMVKMHLGPSVNKVERIIKE
jgi:hypothetical protein